MAQEFEQCAKELVDNIVLFWKNKYFDKERSEEISRIEEKEDVENDVPNDESTRGILDTGTDENSQAVGVPVVPIFLVENTEQNAKQENQDVEIDQSESESTQDNALLNYMDQISVQKEETEMSILPTIEMERTDCGITESTENKSVISQNLQEESCNMNDYNVENDHQDHLITKIDCETAPWNFHTVKIVQNDLKILFKTTMSRPSIKRPISIATASVWFMILMKEEVHFFC